MTARVDLARAALAHGGIVADQLELRLAPADGVEVLQLLPASQLRHGKHGISTSIGDVFIDEGRSLALELRLDLKAGASGKLMEIAVEGRAADGTSHRVTATLQVDIRAGARMVDRDAQREIILVQADAARTQARAQADRGAHPAAASILRLLVAKIDGLEGFVANDGSPLAELREQLVDEAANYERKSTDAERMHQRKQSMAYKSASPAYERPAQHVRPGIAAMLYGIGGAVAGAQFRLFAENSIGRSTSNEIPVASGNLSRRHARVMFVHNQWMIQDLGSTNGCVVNGNRITSHQLREGDLLELGDAVFRFQLVKP